MSGFSVVEVMPQSGTISRINRGVGLTLEQPLEVKEGDVVEFYDFDFEENTCKGRVRVRR